MVPPFYEFRPRPPIRGRSSVLYRPEDLLLYEYDGSILKTVPSSSDLETHHGDKHMPEIWVLLSRATSADLQPPSIPNFELTPSSTQESIHPNFCRQPSANDEIFETEPRYLNFAEALSRAAASAAPLSTKPVVTPSPSAAAH